MWKECKQRSKLREAQASLKTNTTTQRQDQAIPICFNLCHVLHHQRASTSSPLLSTVKLPPNITGQQRTGNRMACSVHSRLSPARRRALLDVLEPGTDCTYLQPSVTKRTLPPRWAFSSSLQVPAAQRWRCWRNADLGIPGAGLSSAGAPQTASSLLFSSQTKPWNLSILRLSILTRS